MEWREDGTVLRRRPHGETAVILDVMTLTHGRHAGVVPGGASVKRAAMLQPGSRVSLHWRARSEEQLGSFSIEPLHARAGLMGDRLALAGLNAVTALLFWALPERDPHPRLAVGTEILLDAMEAAEDWPLGYLHWEMQLLDEMGYGLDLSSCAVSGATEGLCFVSPITGRAVTRAGAGEYAPRLLPLPAILGGGDAVPSGARGRARGPDDLHQGLALTGHFIEARLARQMVGRPVPPARAALLRRLSSPPAAPVG